MSKLPLTIVYGNDSRTSNDIMYVSEKDFLIPYGANYDLAIQELKKIQNSKIDERSFLSLFSYDNVSIWWLIYPSLMPRINKIINFIHKFQILVEDKNPDKIKVENFAYFDLIRQICKSKNVKLQYSRPSLFFYSLNKKAKIFFQRHRYQKITKDKIDYRKKLFFDNNRSIPSLKDKILFVTHSSSWKHVSNSKSKIRGESWQNMLSLLKQEQDVVCMDLDYTLKGDPNVFEEKITDENTWLPMEVMLDSSSFQISRHNSFLKNYIKIINSQEFQSKFNFEGFSLWSQLEDFFHEMLFSPYIPLYLKLLDSTKVFFEKTKPNSVFLSYENGSLAQCLIASLIKLNVKTIGLQHGIIYKNSSNYVFDDFYTTKNSLGFPLPDFLLLFGDYAKKILMENNYPVERLITFGNSFLFNLDNLKKKLSGKILFSKYNIGKNQKVILFATGRHQRGYQAIQGNYDYDEQIWEYLLENFGANNEYFLILKPHPTEYDTDVYQDMIKRFSCKNAKIIQGDLFELISISSVVVSIFSSTMIDALCFQKHVIQVVFDNVKWPVPVEESGVILLSELPQLSKNITKILEDENLRNSLLKNIVGFIKNHYSIPENNPSNIIQDVLSR